MQTNSIYIKKKHPSDAVLTGLIYLCALISIFIVVGIIVYVFVRGVGQIDWTFLTTVKSSKNGTYGIAGNLLNTLYIIIITLLIATPLGVGAAIYLNEYAKPGRLVRAIEFTTETLSGIPSIIFGMFGMVFFGTTLGLGYSILTGALTLTLLILPLITLLVLWLLPISRDLVMVLMVSAACPVASFTIMFAQMLGTDAPRCTRNFAVSTLFSILTLPAILALAQTIL